MCRGMCILLRDPPGGGPPNVLQAGQNTLWVSGTPFTDDRERPQINIKCCAVAAQAMCRYISAACSVPQEVRMADRPN